jgi:imidazolonepropionase-like amidohydrolase
MIVTRPSWWPRLVLATALAWPSVLAAQFNDPPAPAAYALRNVTVVRLDGSRLSGVNVVVRRGVIEAIGPNVELPADARLLEGDSLYIYPGIIDAQGKAKYEFPELEVDREEIASWNPPRQVQSFTPHRRVADYLTANGEDLADQRKKGVVAAAVHPEGRLMPGRGTLLVFRKDAKTPDRLVVQAALGPLMSFRGAQGVYPSTLFAVIAFYRQIFEDARHQAAYAEAYRRKRQGLSPPQWDPDLEVVRQVMDGEARVFFAVDLARDIQRVLRLADEYGFRPVIVGGDEAWKVADELKARKVPVLVSLDFPKPERWKPRKEKGEKEKGKKEEPGVGNGAPQEEEVEEQLDAGALREKQRLEAIYSNAGRLASAGVRFALTSGGGRADILEGARKAIEYGLSEQDALRAITATPASLLGLRDASRVEAGVPANLVVADGPLFDKEAKIRYTFVEGALEEGAKERGTSGEPPAVDLSGTWDLSIESEMGSMSAKVVVKQEGAAFDGSVQSDFGRAKLKDGVVSGNSVTFVIVFSMGDESMEIEFSGTVTGDEASGTGDGPMGSFDWTAKRTGGPGEEMDR